MMHRCASVALLLRTARQLGRSQTYQRTDSTSTFPAILGGLFAAGAASCCTSIAYCEYGESSTGGNLNWAQLVTRLQAHDVTHAKRTTPNGARYELSIRAAPGADMHSVLVALLSAFAPEDARMSAADAPSSTALTVSAGPYTLEFNVPRVRAFDAHISLVVEARGAIEPSFTDIQIRALERAAAIAATPGVTPRPGARDPLTILDENGNPFACRNPHMGNHDSVQSKYTRAKEKLRELGVEVMDASEMNETFDSLAGYSEVKQRIENTLVLPLKHPEVYDTVVRGTREKYKSNVPRAVMLSGPPGCGKTHSARILAATIGVPFVHVPLESLLSKYYGETTRRLASVLEACNGLGRSIVFIDEVDSLAADRGGEVHEVSRRTLSVLLKFLDGVDGPRDAVLLAATNCADDVDAALISRFDCVLEFPLPDKATRAEILTLYARHLSDSERKRIADAAEGFSGREILDSCEDAERAHAGRVVRGELRNDTLPDVDAYLLAVKRKIPMSVSRVEKRKAARRRGEWRNTILAG